MISTEVKYRKIGTMQVSIVMIIEFTSCFIRVHYRRHAA